MEKYVKPKMEVIEFDIDDCIVTSAEGEIGDVGEEGLGGATARTLSSDVYYSNDKYQTK